MYDLVRQRRVRLPVLLLRIIPRPRIGREQRTVLQPVFRIATHLALVRLVRQLLRVQTSSSAVEASHSGRGQIIQPQVTAAALGDGRGGRVAVRLMCRLTKLVLGEFGGFVLEVLNLALELVLAVDLGLDQGLELIGSRRGQSAGTLNDELSINIARRGT
jgi:hypothetical protein